MSRRQAPIIPNARATIADYISPDNGYRGRMERLGNKPKNHIQQNVRELRELESRKREEKELMSQSPKSLYKLPQFRDVTPRLHSHNYADENQNMERNTEFLSKGISEKRREELALRRRQDRLDMETRMEELRQVEQKPSTPRKPKIPKCNEVATLLPRNNSDFIKKNRMEAISMQPKSEIEEIQESKHKEYGHIPKYLEDFKAEWEREQEDRRRGAPDPNCPPGMKLMSEEERVETLEVLKRNREETMVQFRRLPFVVETPSMINRKNDLEMKLKEIENAITLFSRPRVYVKL